MHNNYSNSILRELRDQVRFAPREKKLEQADRAERLLGEIEPNRTYTYEYLCYRITDYRPDAAPHKTMTGAEAHHDLPLFVEDIFEGADVDADELREPVHTVDDLSRMFNVSTKTISRWRQQGLVSRRFVMGGRKRVGFLKSSVDRFVAANRDRVQRGERFSQLTELERNEIVERARRLAAAGGGQAEVTRRLADQTRRSVETIRYTLKQHDKKNPQAAIFPELTGPLTAEAKQRIYQQHRAGASVESLAKRYGRTRSRVHAVINEMRAARIMELPLDYIDNEVFRQAKQADVILAPLPEAHPKARKARPPADLPNYLSALYEVPLLTAEQERHLFRKLNYLKHAACQLREQLDVSRPLAPLMDEIERLYEEAVRTKNQIVKANLRLVVSIAKRHVSASDDFFALVSDGNMSLIRAVEKFDYARGNKFSTYASWAIMKNFARTIPDEFKHRDRFRTSQEETFVGVPDRRADQYEQELAQVLRERQVGQILNRLDEREQKIIICRFGLDHHREPQTLKEVGAEMGVTKERVRQLEARALNKLRQAAAEAHIDLPEA